MGKQVFDPGNFIGFYTTAQITDFPVEMRRIGNFVWNTTTLLLLAYATDGEAFPSLVWGGSGAFVMIEGIVNPNGTVTGFYGQKYRNTVSGIIYICISNPTGTAWTVV